MMNPSMPTPGRRQPRGLTLIELMIGLAICAVLMSLAVPSFAAYLQRQRLKAAAQGLELDLREARFEAAQRGSSLFLKYSPGADWCYAITTHNACDCRVQQPCRLKTVRASDRRGVQLAEFQDAGFDPASGKGDVTGTVAILRAPGGERVRVNLAPTGRASVCMLDGNLPSIAGC